MYIYHRGDEREGRPTFRDPEAADWLDVLLVLNISILYLNFNFTRHQQEHLGAGSNIDIEPSNMNS